MFFDIISLLIEAVGLTSSLRRDRDAVVADLRLIRFNEAGILGLLRRLLANEVPDPVLATTILHSFNDREEQVSRAVKRLAADLDSASRPMSYELASRVKLISYGKVSLREEVQSVLNEYGQVGFVAQRRAAAALTARIIELNRQIDNAEHVLLHGGNAA